MKVFDSSVKHSGITEYLFLQCRHLCSVIPVSPGHNMNVHGKITYKANLSTKRLFFDLNIQSVDLLRYVQYHSQVEHRTHMHR